MQKILALLAVILIALMIFISIYFAKDAYQILPGMPPATPIGNIAGWHEFSAPHHFKVMLPSIPQHATESIVDPKTKENKKYDMYVAENGIRGAYMITMITFTGKDKIEDQDALFKNVIHDMVVVNPNNQLKEMKETTFKNFKAIDFSIENEDLTVKGREFINGKTLYVLSSMEKKPITDKGEDQSFFNSFELLAPPTSLSGDTPFPLQN